MQRRDTHSPRVDDNLDEDFEPVEHANRPTRNEWREPEPPAEQYAPRSENEETEATDDEL